MASDDSRAAPLVLELPQRQQLALLRLGVEDSLLATPDPVLLRMFSQIHTVIRIAHTPSVPASRAKSHLQIACVILLDARSYIPKFTFLTERSIKSMLID